MLVGCLALVLSAANVEPTVAVLVSRRTGVPAATADALARQVSTALTAERVPLKLDADAARAAVTRLGLSDAAACDGRKRCVTELARQLGVEWVVGLSFAQLGGDRSMAIELFRQSDGAVVAKDALLLGANTDLAPEQLAPFAARVREVLGVATPPPPTDAPVATRPPQLTPEPPPPPPPVVVAEPPPPQKGHAASLGLGAAGVASLVAGVVLMVSGTIDHADAVATTPVGAERRARYPADEVLRRANDADARSGLGVGLSALALGLGAAAVLAW